MSKDPEFNCDKCGLCCRCLKDNSAVKGTELESCDRGDGVCKYLTKDNLCSIYEARPLVCNVRGQYYAKYADKMTLEEYYEMQRNACEVIKKTAAARNMERFGL